MNTDRKTGNWRQFVDKTMEKWGRRADETWQVVKDTRDASTDRMQERVNKIRHRYGVARDEADPRVTHPERAGEPDPNRNR